MTRLLITLFVAGVGCFPDGGGLSGGGGSFHDGSGVGIDGHVVENVHSGSGSFKGGISEGYNTPDVGSIKSTHGLAEEVNLGVGGGYGHQTHCNDDASCGQLGITRDLYLYNAPRLEAKYGPLPSLPNPKIHYNYVFLRTPTNIAGARPIIAPPPQQKTLVYVLSKKPGAQEQQVIEVPQKPTKPEVFFVAYDHGDNPKLPGGIDLQSALNLGYSDQHQGKNVDTGLAGTSYHGSQSGSSASSIHRESHTGSSGGGYSSNSGSGGGISGHGGSSGGGSNGHGGNSGGGFDHGKINGDTESGSGGTITYGGSQSGSSTGSIYGGSSEYLPPPPLGGGYSGNTGGGGEFSSHGGSSGGGVDHGGISDAVRIGRSHGEAKTDAYQSASSSPSQKSSDRSKPSSSKSTRSAQSSSGPSGYVSSTRFQFKRSNRRTRSRTSSQEK